MIKDGISGSPSGGFESGRRRARTLHQSQVKIPPGAAVSPGVIPGSVVNLSQKHPSFVLESERPPWPWRRGSYGRFM